MAGSLWEVLSAIGTLSAVVVALGISILSSRENRKAEMDRAELAAAKMFIPLSNLYDKASGLYSWYAFGDFELNGSESEVMKRLEAVEALSQRVSIDDLFPLLKLPRHVAKRAARAQGLIQASVDYAREMFTYSLWKQADDSFKDDRYARLFYMLLEVRDHLEIVVRECESSALNGAPRPTLKEIQCDD